MQVHGRAAFFGVVAVAATCAFVSIKCGGKPGRKGYCGDGVCQTDSESLYSCPEDCEGVCGNGVLETDH